MHEIANFRRTLLRYV